MDDRTLHARVGEVEEALDALEALPSAPRETALAAVSALVDLYGEGLARALARLEPICPEAAPSLAADELVGHLLMLHGLHPLDVEVRVRRALDELRTSVDADGVEAELLGMEEGVVRIRLRANGKAPGPGFSALVEGVVHGAAPELDRVEVDVPTAGRSEPRPALVQLRLSRPGKERSRVEESGG